MSLLRDRLLAGRRIALAGTPGRALSDALTGLGADLQPFAVEELPAEAERAGEWARLRAPLHAVVYCAADGFGTDDGAALARTLEEAWVAVREVATGALIPGDPPAQVVLIAPRPDAGPLVGAARAGLENLVRTLSVEWARYGLTAVLVAPGANATDLDLATVTCFVLSEAGGYLSGCRLELGAVG